MPSLVKDWLRQHPELILDPAQNERLQKMHFVAEHQAGEADTPAYLERLDELLGYRPAPPPRAASVQTYSRAPTDQPRPAPARPQAPAVSYSAPPHRDVPTMRTGRTPSVRTPLSADELEVARSSGMTPEQYAEAKRMLTEQERIGPRARDGR
jgi:hypothetical protein